MGYLDKAVNIADLDSRQLWVIWGKSGSGKTEILGTFPKPLLYIRVGDDGSGTISNVKGIKALEANTTEELKAILEEAKSDEKYATVVIDTFSLLVQEWIDLNVTKKKKKMTQQTWGDLKTEAEELIRLASELAMTKIVVLTCHEVTDTIEGMEDEILPDIRPSVNKGARTYLEGMANYGIHTAVVVKETDTGEVTRHIAHLAPNAYYWTKVQKPSRIRLPKSMVNPTYDKIILKLQGGK